MAPTYFTFRSLLSTLSQLIPLYFDSTAQNILDSYIDKNIPVVLEYIAKPFGWTRYQYSSTVSTVNSHRGLCASCLWPRSIISKCVLTCLAMLIYSWLDESALVSHIDLILPMLPIPAVTRVLALLPLFVRCTRSN